MTGMQKKILVVDDSHTIRMLLREELEEGGYEVIEARNGLEAIINAASESPPDIVTLDIEMPKLDGFATCQRLRDKNYTRFFSNNAEYRLPVIFITGNDTVDDRKKGFELGAVDFITKPFRKGEILAAVNKILQPVIQKGITALVADDSSLSRKTSALCLSREGIDIIETDDGQKAYEIIQTSGDSIDIVITDLFMPNMDGMKLCKRIRQDLGNNDMPIIVLTEMAEISEILDIFKAGASDYLIKPFAKEELLARINVHIERNKVNRELRETIKLLKNANERIKKLSIIDPLTGCYNRGYLNKQFLKELNRSLRYNKPLSIILADIDYFKKINDSYGHQFGDEVLVRFAEILNRNIRDDIDWVVRYGGEEFLVVLPETGPAKAKIIAERFRKAVASEQILVQKRIINITSSFGVTGFDAATGSTPPDMEQLVRIADDNLYSAKNDGRNRVVSSFFS